MLKIDSPPCRSASDSRLASLLLQRLHECRIPHQDRGLAFLFFQIEQVVGPNRLMRQPPYGRDDRGDAAARRFHPSHSDPQEVLPAIPRFACEVRRFDPAAFQVLLESCRHVQYSASYADEG